MKKVLMVFMAVLLITGLVYAKDLEVKKKTSSYEVEVKIDKNPPVVGKNNIEVEIKDAQGKYVTDAKVQVEYSMPAMPGMPAMNYKADAKLDGYEYKAVIEPSMSGARNIAVKITRGGKTETVKFNIDAR